MADLKYSELRTEYNAFKMPAGMVYIGGERFADNKFEFGITNIVVENTCGFEASIASFDIMNAFDTSLSEFEFKNLKKYVSLGNSAVIYLGYDTSLKEVFRGFISAVNYKSERGYPFPVIRITVMDIKGIMMSGSYSKQLKATSYSEAVKEIFKRTNYGKIIPQTKAGAAPGSSDYSSIITGLDVKDTPDFKAGGGEGGGEKKDSDVTIEMVAESDYEFVVKAAKKFNYEFFTYGGNIIFRKARSVKEILIDLNPSNGIVDFDVEYAITGLVNKVEVRAMDPGKSKLINATQNLNNKISFGSKAKSLINGVQKVYIDPSVKSKEDAQARAEYLAENIAYGFGTARIEMVGLPDIIPGRFITISGMGFAKAPSFYITQVNHHLSSDGEYTTRFTAQCCTLQ